MVGVLPEPGEGHGDLLLSIPTDEELRQVGTERVPIERTRKSARYQDLCDSFRDDIRGSDDKLRLSACNFELQYASTYFARLNMLKNAIVEAAKAKWVASRVIPSDHLLEGIGHVTDRERGVTVAIYGCVVKEVKLRPSVLAEIQKTAGISGIHPAMTSEGYSMTDSYTSDEDKIYLEDSSSRIRLVVREGATVDLNRLCQGLVLAFKGTRGRGCFEVDEMVYPLSLSPKAIPSSRDAEYVGFVSGLRLGQESVARSMLAEWITGAAVDKAETDAAPSAMVRLIIAGDTLGGVTTQADLNGVDKFLARVAKSVPVTILPGAQDPANFALPQQPLHSALFPESRKIMDLTAETNPARFQVGDCVFLGSTGACVKEVTQYSTTTNVLDALELTARGRVIAPTAPDTIACYPFPSFDPLVITDEEPVGHVMFSANHDKAEFRVVDFGDAKVTLLSVSAFTSDPVLLLVNINDPVDVKRVSFRADGISEEQKGDADTPMDESS
ncbi:DNA polymerase delta small subunit, putative [Perkinsus marinus ATCC 50983]|uniref:DNA polymerase delta small subunit, putative n=1 Tax=Perkinsus marinus (strain ATCC 50983 / TXsc) TaxID=423536 RepID=C5KK79_PERM5|nr:DNA polymerase delta small subunit, putative [Perkinsus marinus ATCC 50983]EER14991.1 DNA polymerase delta small subunit, putative [Perkinsus marinus ATCC 50983]|eukprot:XP_002783195.1 DNA polymerase delta small subunit, putative [Perkinsus marinus ATCC 50983]